MSDTQIKICGLTSVADARLCAEIDVDMVGLNFSPQSARCISQQRAQEILFDVRINFPRVKFVGLFVDQPFEVVQKTINELALDAVQLHGNESPEFVRRISASFRIKALRVTPDFRLTSALDYNCDAILLDCWSPERPGGTGTIFDWSIAAQLQPRLHRLILAGGLNAENVGEAIETVRPFAVDVCSGVEDEVGRKSETKLRRFVEKVRTRERAITTA